MYLMVLISNILKTIFNLNKLTQFMLRELLKLKERKKEGRKKGRKENKEKMRPKEPTAKALAEQCV